MMLRVTLPNGDNAEAETPGAILRAANQLVREAAENGAASVWLLRELYVTEHETIYRPDLTGRARRGEVPKEDS